MFPIRFHSEAYDEMIEAARYYEAQSEGLGGQFLGAVTTATHHIQLKPNLYADILPDRKRCLVGTFPFCVIYRIKDQVIEIIAVAHTRLLAKKTIGRIISKEGKHYGRTG